MTGEYHRFEPRPDAPRLPPIEDRYQTIIAMLTRIINELSALRRDVDDIDRTLKPYGDGTKLRRMRR